MEMLFGLILSFLLLLVPVGGICFVIPQAVKSLNPTAGAITKFILLLFTALLLSDDGFCNLLFSIPVGFYLYRWVARLTLGRAWQFWYVRRAIDISMVGFGLLLCASFCGASHIPEQMARELPLQTIRQPDFFWHHMNFYLQFDRLDVLSNFLWLMEHIGQFVVLPAFMTFAAGYAIDRRRQNRDATSVNASGADSEGPSANTAGTQQTGPAQREILATLAKRALASLVVTGFFVLTCWTINLLNPTAGNYAKTLLVLGTTWLAGVAVLLLGNQNKRLTRLCILSGTCAVLVLSAMGLKSIGPPCIMALDSVKHAESGIYWRWQEEAAKDFFRHF